MTVHGHSEAQFRINDCHPSLTDTPEDMLYEAEARYARECQMKMQEAMRQAEHYRKEIEGTGIEVPGMEAVANAFDETGAWKEAKS